MSKEFTPREIVDAVEHPEAYESWKGYETPLGRITGEEYRQAIGALRSVATAAPRRKGGRHVGKDWKLYVEITLGIALQQPRLTNQRVTSLAREEYTRRTEGTVNQRDSEEFTSAIVRVLKEYGHR